MLVRLAEPDGVAPIDLGAAKLRSVDRDTVYASLLPEKQEAARTRAAQLAIFMVTRKPSGEFRLATRGGTGG
jgi:hypothetical protein